MHGIAVGAERMLPRVPAGEAAAIIAGVLGPTLAKGVIIRRPAMVALAERWNLDARGVARMQRLHDTYGPGPLLIGPIRGRCWALVLEPSHVSRILDGSPEPFATATGEKIASLSHFEPKVSLVSQGESRAVRRRFNERVLEVDRPVHHLADRFATVVRQESRELLRQSVLEGELEWEPFYTAWFRIVRRVVFGDSARDDHDIIARIERLRAAANWSVLRSPRVRERKRFLERLEALLQRAEPGSLAAVIANTPVTPDTAPAHQVPQWLFAFDPAGMATYRTLALLATHRDCAARARAEVRAAAGDGHDLPYVRACVLESLRLWPTAPLVLRQSVEETRWESGVMPSQTGIIMFAPYFHRDDRRLPFAHRLAPEVWLDGRPAEAWPLIPFSAGPARCPGRQLVELVTSLTLARLLEGAEFELKQSGRLDPQRPLPGTLNHYSLRFRVRA